MAQDENSPMAEEACDAMVPRRRMVIADGHPGILASLRCLLERKFHIVGEASDGRALIEVATQLRPDIILLDQSMPGMTGIEAAAQLRALVPDCALIMLSAHLDRDLASAAFSAGITGYIVKRDPRQLVDFIRKVVVWGEPGTRCFYSC